MNNNMTTIINPQFKPNVSYLYEISYLPKESTDQPEIRNINIKNNLNEIDNYLIGHIENSIIGNGDTSASGVFSLKYIGNQKSFTSNIDLTIDGITDYEDGLIVPIVCNGTLELKPLRFRNTTDEDIEINISARGSGFADELKIKYCIIDSETEPNTHDWIEFIGDHTDDDLKIISFTIQPGKSLCIRSNGMSSWHYNENYLNHFYFKSSHNGGIELGGDIMSLIESENMDTYCFYHLFENLSALSSFAEDFSLSSNLSPNCYDGMFYNCTSLKNIPENLLPAEKLANGCYNAMFCGCISLENIPENLLPAEELANYCYQDMFNGCTGLETIPVDLLPATTLAEYCYKQMFYGCTGLTNIPKNLLPATILAYECYRQMFYGCTSLTSVASDLLPATTLTSYCYRGMFYYCKSLTTAPILPATTLANYCYTEMFRECSNLNNITMLATNIATQCFDDWVSGVSATGTFYKAELMSTQTIESSIPSGWTVQNYVSTND